MFTVNNKDTRTMPDTNVYKGYLGFFLFCLNFKGALSGLSQFLETERTLKMTKNAFYFTSKAFFVPKIFNFLSLFFYYVAKRLNKKR